MLRKISIYTLYLVLALALFLSAKWGVAAASNSLAMRHLEHWQEYHKKPSLEQWQQTYDALIFASSLDSNNAEYHNDLGRFYDFSADVMEDTEASQLSFRHKAVDAFRLTLALNPSWSIAWGNLALLKHKVGEIDDEFFLAVNQSLDLGGSLRPVQVIMGFIGVRRWAELSPPLRDKMLDNFHYVLNSKHRFELIKTMKYYSMLPYFCLKFADEDRQKFCRVK